MVRGGRGGVEYGCIAIAINLPVDFVEIVNFLVIVIVTLSPSPLDEILGTRLHHLLTSTFNWLPPTVAANKLHGKLRTHREMNFYYNQNLVSPYQIFGSSYEVAHS